MLMRINPVRKSIAAVSDTLGLFKESRGQSCPRSTLAILCVFAWLSAFTVSAAIISTRPIHLRSGDEPEWEQFAALKPDGKQFNFTFNAERNTNPSTLFIRQHEVRQDWIVELNGQRVGRLFTMEADLIHTLNVPAGVLKD